MRKIGLLIGFLSFLPFWGFSQGQEVRHFYDAEREHIQERYFVKDNEPSILYGAYESYYYDGSVKSKGQYVNNEAFGTWKYYYENGHLKMRGQLRNNSNYGEWTYFYENGNMRMQGNILDEQREGEWTFYYENGSLKSKGKYKNNKKVGLWNYYYEDQGLKAQALYQKGIGIYKEFYPGGHLKTSGYIIDGKSDSLWTNFYEDGQKKSEGTYDEGLKEGVWKFYYANGQLMASGNYEDGQSNGKWTYYYENGKLSSEGAERDGQKEGYWKLYYESGKVKGEGVFEDGTGDYQEFYESGKMRVKGQYKDGVEDGPWYYYYESGELEGKAEYEEGKGTYTGYYEGGAVKMKGQVEKGNKVGTWELYKPNGDLAGYYKPFYEDKHPIFKQWNEENLLDKNPDYQKPEFRFKTKKFTYFQKRLNELKFLSLEASVPDIFYNQASLSLEYMIQERLGYELQGSYLQKPWLNAPYDEEGFRLAFKQKFYHKDTKWGMPYFGHELAYTQIIHYANESAARVSQQEDRYQYGLFVGSHWMRRMTEHTWAIDATIGFDMGYRDVGQPSQGMLNVPNIPKSGFVVTPRFKLSIGYSLRLTKVTPRN